eukprot:891717-Pyramimonas_sp.AAC.3
MLYKGNERRGVPTRSSAKMHPTDHMSISGPYLVAPRSSSGGLWQRVHKDKPSGLLKHTFSHVYHGGSRAHYWVPWR